MNEEKDNEPKIQHSLIDEITALRRVMGEEVGAMRQAMHDLEKELKEHSLRMVELGEAMLTPRFTPANYIEEMDERAIKEAASKAVFKINSLVTKHKDEYEPENPIKALADKIADKVKDMVAKHKDEKEPENPVKIGDITTIYMGGKGFDFNVVYDAKGKGYRVSMDVKTLTKEFEAHSFKLIGAALIVAAPAVSDLPIIGTYIFSQEVRQDMAYLAHNFNYTYFGDLYLTETELQNVRSALSYYNSHRLDKPSICYTKELVQKHIDIIDKALEAGKTESVESETHDDMVDATIAAARLYTNTATHPALWLEKANNIEDRYYILLVSMNGQVNDGLNQGILLLRRAVHWYQETDHKFNADYDFDIQTRCTSLLSRLEDKDFDFNLNTDEVELIHIALNYYHEVLKHVAEVDSTTSGDVKRYATMFDINAFKEED